MRHPTQHASRIQTSGSIPQQLIGDWYWHSQAMRLRFNYDGNFSLIIQGAYTINNDQILHLGGETYERRAGTTGLIGVWRDVYSTGEWVDITFGSYFFYAFEWNDGVSGGGFYSATDTEYILVENRARFSCEGDTITFINGEVTETGRFTISGDLLTIQFPDRTDEYTKILF